MNLARVAVALLVIVPVWAVMVLLCSLLPTVPSLGCALAGVVLFQAGGELGWRWTAVVGGACMFSGVFAWALAVT